MKSKLSFLLFILFLAISFSFTSDHYHGLDVIHSIEKYKQSVKQNASKTLIDLEDFIKGIHLDIRYATANNFTGEVIYEQPKAYVRKPVAEALKKIQAELNAQDLGLKIFDAYRPYAATLKFYEVYPDTNFVAAPWKGSRHNRGCAVDITLINFGSKKELEMPTGFDDFSEKANPNYKNVPETAIKNRSLLISTMKKHGFTVYPTEWWHFDYQGWENFELMDISFTELENL